MPPKGVYHDNPASATLSFNGFRIALPADELRDKVLTAIVKAILHSGANIPRTPREITAIIMQNGYAHLGGQTPHATISSRISMHFKKFNESKGRRVPLLGRVLSESNNRRIKYYVLQLPFVPDDDCSIVMQPDEPAKPAKSGPPPPTTPRIRRGSSASIDLKEAQHRKRKATSVKTNAVTARKKNRRKVANAESDSNSDSESISTGGNSEGSVLAERMQVEEYPIHGDQLSVGPELHDARVEEAETVSTHHREIDHDDEDSSSESSGEESQNNVSDIDEDRSPSQPAPPPQNPLQTYTFSPVFQPHIFIRPNTTSLPPLSTLHQQSVISQLSPPLMSASPALNNQTHTVPTIGPVNRMLIPSPILLPSPRALTVLSPQLGSGGSLNNIHPLDLGPGLYVPQQLSNSTSTQLHHQAVPVSHSITVKNPESISVGELDELLHEHDQSSKTFTKLKKANETVHHAQTIHYQRKATSKQHNQIENGAKRVAIAHRSPTAANVVKQHDKHSMTDILKSPPNVFKAKQHILVPKSQFEFVSLHVHVPSHTTNATGGESGRIITLSKLKKCPPLSITSYLMSAVDELKLVGPKLHELSACVRIGEVGCAFPDLAAYSKESDTKFSAPWRKYCDLLIRLSANSSLLSLNITNASNHPEGNTQAVPPVISDVPNGHLVQAGESFAVQVALDEEDLIEAFTTSSLMIFVLKNTGGSIGRECWGIWIPQETAKHLTAILNLPAKVNDLFAPDSRNSASSVNGSMRNRSFSVSSASSDVSSSRFQTNLSAADSVDDEGFLKFDESDEDIDIGTKDAAVASTPILQQSFVATSVDPSALTLIPSANVTESLIWMTTIDGVFVYITWVGENIIRIPPSTSQNPSGSVNFRLPTGNGLPILRRVDNGMVNASQLLNAGGLTTERERSVVLSLERFKKRHRMHTSVLRGTWIPLSRARELARTLSLDNRLRMFLTDNAGALWFAGVMPSPIRVVKKAGGGGSRVGGAVSPTSSGVSGSAVDPGSTLLGARNATKAFAGARKQLMQAQKMASAAAFGGAQRNIYPPGSLAAVKYAMAQRAAALQAAEDSLKQAVAGDATASNGEMQVAKAELVESIGSSPGKGKVGHETNEHEHDSPDTIAVKQTAKVDAIAATESATRTAITALANTLAHQIRTNSAFTPPIVAATLAALATGAKKINDAVRTNPASNAGPRVKPPTAAAILQAFANSMAGMCGDAVTAVADGITDAGAPAAKADEDANASRSIAEGQFRPANLAGASSHVLAQLRASIEGAARGLLRPSPAATASTSATTAFAAAATIKSARQDTDAASSVSKPAEPAAMGPSAAAASMAADSEHEPAVASAAQAAPGRPPTSSQGEQPPHAPRVCDGQDDSAVRSPSPTPRAGRGKSVVLPRQHAHGGKSWPAHAAVADQRSDYSSSSSDDDDDDGDDDDDDAEYSGPAKPGTAFVGGAKKRPAAAEPLQTEHLDSPALLPKAGVRRNMLPLAARPLVAVKAPRVPAPVVIQAVADEDDEEDIDILN